MSYLPSTRNVPAPVGQEPQAHAGPAYRFQPSRTGSQRDYHRGWGGDRELSGGLTEQIGGFAAQNIGRFLYFNTLAKRQHGDMEQIHSDLTHQPVVGSRLGARSTGGNADAGTPGAPATDHASFGAIPKMYADRTDPFGHLPTRSPVAQAPSQREAPQRARGVGPKSGLGSSPLDPARRTAFSGERPSLAVQEQATSTTPGRRAPAGMDPRKRGTWANYE